MDNPNFDSSDVYVIYKKRNWIFSLKLLKQLDSIDKLSITHLTFGDEFNQFVDSLPESITHLTFGERFRYSFSIYSCTL